MKARGIAAGLLLAAATLAAGSLAAPAASAGPGHGLIVRTDRGLIQGTYTEGADQFLGIPYAAPPVGALRWAAPHPAPRWRGIRQATSYGGRCAQLASGNGPRVDNEDLSLIHI